jgi:hypothetical protein
MRQIGPIACVAFALVLSACGGSPPSAPVSSALPPAPAPAVAPAKPAPGGPEPGVAMVGKEQMPAVPEPSGPKYDAKGRRDPFEALDAVEGPANTTVASAKLTGIVRKVGGPTLALIETADGLGYIVQAGDMFGDGRLIEINQDAVVFTVASRRGSGNQRVILKLGE